MLKSVFIGISLLLLSGTAVAQPVDYIAATTLSFTSDGPTLHDQPNGTPGNQERITLDDTGNSGWYIAPNFAINLLGGFNDNNLEITYDTGYSYGVSIGKEVNPGFRIQLDLAHMKNDLERVFVSIAPGITVPVTDAKITQTPIILNAIWEPRGHDRLFPYIGLGAGAIKGKYSVAEMPPAFVDLLDIGWAFALQVKVGIKYELSHSSNVSLGYQFLHAHYNSDLDLNNNVISIGLEFKF
jgi:opacity protein-like surface antigen